MPSASRLPSDQVLDLHDAARLLVAALDDGERRVAAVGIFHLRLHAGIAEIELGRECRRCAARLDHRLVVADAVAVHDQHDHRPVGLAGSVSLPSAASAACSRDTPMEKPVAGTSSLHEAADQPVIAPAAADRAEHDRLALLVRDLERQLGLEDGAGVVFEAADDRGIDSDAVLP